jgi:hypothetical protein
MSSDVRRADAKITATISVVIECGWPRCLDQVSPRASIPAISLTQEQPLASPPLRCVWT